MKICLCWLGNLLEVYSAPVSRFVCSQCYKPSPNKWIKFIQKFCCGGTPEGGWICVWLCNTEEINVSKTVWPQKLQVTELLMGFFHTDLWLNSISPGSFLVRSQEVRQVVTGEAEFIKPGFPWLSYISHVWFLQYLTVIYLTSLGRFLFISGGLVIWVLLLYLATNILIILWSPSISYE